MTYETDWNTLSNEYAIHNPAIMGEIIHPQKTVTMKNIDGIFTNYSRKKADALCKPCIADDINEQAYA